MEENTVCFLTYDWTFGSEPLEPNGCNWYRCVLPTQELRKNGWIADVGFPGYSKEYGFGLLQPDESYTHGWDVIVFKLIMLGTVADAMEEAKQRGQKIVVDLDDWFEGLHPTNAAYKMTDPKVNPQSNRDYYMRIIANADALITSTPFLQDYYTNVKGHKHVYLVRNGIDLDRWTPKKDHSRYLPKVGWVGATPWRSQDLETMSPWFGKWMREKRLDFHHSGSIKGAPTAAEQLGLLPGTKFTHQGMEKISKYPELFRRMDIGIVPLSNIEFNHAKSVIKGLEYAAAGIPFVASYSPEYALLEGQGIGRVANNVDEWIGHLDALIDPRTRKEDAERNLEGIRKYQSMAVRGPEWSEVMHQIKNL